jgi:hypothetical protein
MRPFRLTLLLPLFVLADGPAFAAKPVAAVGKANSSYLERRLIEGKPKRETYVFMEGSRLEGTSRDRTFETTTFREIAEFLAPKLTQQNYWPTPELKDADLLLIVHWGVTSPRASLNDMTARVALGTPLTSTSEVFADSPAFQDYANALGGNVSLNLNASEQRMYQLEEIVEQDAQNIQGAGTARLLGYTETLLKLNQSARYTETQFTLDSDMRSERYFIIVRAYDLHAGTKWQRSRPVWVLHLNTASPGNNFKTALASMSEAGARMFGKNTDGVATIRPDRPAGHVELHDIVIIGEAK